MTENKFGVITNWCIYENVNGIEKWLNFDEVVDLLNEQQETIQLLQDDNEMYKSSAENYCRRLNEVLQENEQLKQVSQDYEDNVSKWFIENWYTLSDEQKQSTHLELGIDIEYGDKE